MRRKQQWMVVIVEEEGHSLWYKTVKHKCESIRNLLAAKLLLNVRLGGMGEELWRPLSGSRYSIEESRTDLAGFRSVYLNPPITSLFLSEFLYSRNDLKVMC
jgi:hypothetical protein